MSCASVDTVESSLHVKTYSRREVEGLACLCGDSECSHLSGAFAVLKDARGKFVKLPSPTDKQRRDSYLRHLFPNKKAVPKLSTSESHDEYYIALHHFHPSLIAADGSLPKNISLGLACQLRMKLDQRDKVLDQNGMPAFYTVPNYPLERVEMDLEKVHSENTNNNNNNNNTATKQLVVQEFEIPQHVNVLLLKDDFSDGNDTADHNNDNGSIDTVSSVGSGDWRDTSLAALAKRDRDTLLALQSAAIICQSAIRRHQAKKRLVQAKDEYKHNAVATTTTVRSLRRRPTSSGVATTMRRTPTPTNVGSSRVATFRQEQRQLAVTSASAASAAVTIQHAYRRHVVKKQQAKSLLVEHDHAATRIQAQVRGAMSRTQLLEDMADSAMLDGDKDYVPKMPPRAEEVPSGAAAAHQWVNHNVQDKTHRDDGGARYADQGVLILVGPASVGIVDGLADALGDDDFEEDKDEDEEEMANRLASASAAAIQAAWRCYWAQFQYRLSRVDVIVVKSIFDSAQLPATVAALTPLCSLVAGWSATKGKATHDSIVITIKTKWKRYAIHSLYERTSCGTEVRVSSEYHYLRQVHRDLRFVRATAFAIPASWATWRCKWPQIQSIQYRPQEPDIVLVQSLARKKLAREELERRRAAVLTLQSSARQWRVTTNLASQRAASTTIQALWRGYDACQRYPKRLEGVVVIQSAARKLLALCKIQALGFNASMIQSACRRYCARKEYLRCLRGIILLQSQSRQRAVLPWWQLAELYHGCATSIQRMWRGLADYDRICLGAIRCLQNATRRWVAVRRVEEFRLQEKERMRKRRLAGAACKVQAMARGVLCRKELGWIVTFIRMAGSEIHRQKAHHETLQNAHSSWKQSIEMLENGIREIGRAHRLLLSTSLADRALTEAFGAIAKDTFLDNDGNVVASDTRHQNESLLPIRNQFMPVDPLLISLLKAEERMADRFGDASGYGLSDIAPEFSALRQELEAKAKEIKRIGNSFVKSMPTREMKESDKAASRAWDELEDVVFRLWNGKKSRDIATQAAFLRKQDSTSRLPSANGSLSSASSPTPATSTDDRSPSAPSCNLLRHWSPPQVTSTPPRRTPSGPPKEAFPPDLQCPSLVHTPSAQSDCTSGSIVLSPAGSSNRLSSDERPSNSQPVVSERSQSSRMLRDSDMYAAPISPSSCRALFHKQVSTGPFSPSPDLCSDECTAIMTKEGSEKRGMEFFDHLANISSEGCALPDPPELAPLQRSSSFGNQTVHDRWLRESNYHAAVAHHAFIWHASLDLFTKMSEAVMDIEMDRTKKLNALLLVTLPLERRMLLEMREVHETVVHEMLNIRHDRLFLSECINDTIQKHAKILRHHDSDHKSSILNRSRPLSPDLTNTFQHLEPEATYGVTHQAMVVERSVGLLSWKTTLAVVTVDSCMHLFDVSFIPEISVGSSAIDAFDRLLPDEDFSDEGARVVPRDEKLLKYLHPVSTVNLRNCIISRGEDQSSLEVTETYIGLFGAKSTKKVILRGTPSDLANWMHFLKRNLSWVKLP